MNFKLYDLPTNRLPLTNPRIFGPNEFIKDYAFLKVKPFEQLESKEQKKDPSDLKKNVFSKLNFCGIFFMQYILLLCGLNYINKNPKIRFLNDLFSYFILCLSLLYMVILMLFAFHEENSEMIYLPILICIVRIIISLFFIKNQSKIIKLNNDLKALHAGEFICYP